MSAEGLESICYTALTMASIGWRDKKPAIIYIGVLNVSLDTAMHILNMLQTEEPLTWRSYF